MKTHLILLFFLSISLLSAQTPPSAKGSASIQVIRTDNPQTHINLARTHIQELTSWIDNYEIELSESTKTTSGSPGAGRSSNLNMSKSNRSTAANPIYNSRNALKSLANALDQFEMSTTENQRHSLSELHKAQNELNKAIETIHKSILERGAKYVDKAAELKVKHDTAMNSIRNLRG